MTKVGLLPSLPPPPEGRAGWPWTVETDPALMTTEPPKGWPMISIICPSFRQGRYIEEAIRSVLLQNYPQTELIVMDAGSQDETVPILTKYSRWIKHWESRPDRGQSHALNKACALARGEIFGWINSDDYHLPGAYAAVGRAFRARPHSLIYGDWYERNGEDPALTPRRESPALAFQIAVGGRHLPSHTTFWPRAAHQPFEEALQFTMDAELFKRLAASGLRPVHLPQPIGVFRHHAGAKTATLATVAQAETEAWSRAQPWHTHLRWKLSRWLDRVRRQ